MKGKNREITCKNCGVLDVNCYEQCKEKGNNCNGCFGASFNDCECCGEKEALEHEAGGAANEEK